MLALLSVLPLADVVGLVRLLPFFALAAALFLAAAVLVWRWATGEAERAIVDGPPRVAREQFGRGHGEAEPAATEAMAGSRR